MEEDVDDDGLVLNTRIFDKKGKKTMDIKVKKHKKIKGIPIPEYMETVGYSPAGEVFSATTCTGIEVEVE